MSPGNIMTGLLDKSGIISEPELQSAAHTLCSSEHTAAVSEGFVSVGVAIAEVEHVVNRLIRLRADRGSRLLGFEKV